MSDATTRRIVAATVLVAGLWPLVHLVLVTRLEVDPWELFGWGMYSTPSPQVQVRIEQVHQGRPLLVRPSDATLRQLERFTARRNRLGRLVSVAALADRVLALEPQMEGIDIVLRRWRLDRETARFTFSEERRRFLRGGTEE